MAIVITLLILAALGSLLLWAAANCPLIRLLSCSFDQWADACRNEHHFH